MNCNCKYCKKSLDIDVRVDWHLYVCVYCGETNINPELNISIQEQYTPEKYKNTVKDTRLGLFVGDKCTIEGTEYYVIGLIEKQQHANEWWAEYILKGANDSYRYISESDGHWVMLEEIDTYEEVLEVAKGKVDVEYEESRKVSYKFHPVRVQGLFDFNPFQSGTIEEVANAPYLYSTEVYKQSNKEIHHFYFGKYVRRKQILQWFPKVGLRMRKGVGIVEPFWVDIKQMAYIFLATALLLLLLNIGYYWNDDSEREIYSTKLEFVKGQDFSSPSFPLKGHTGTLKFQFYSPVDNNWASCDILLVNDNTGNKKYFSKDVEYYHGVDGGESWNEGGQMSKAKVCGVVPGSYHIEFNISRDSTNIMGSSYALNGSSTDAYINVSVIWNKPNIWNLNFIVIGMVVVLLILYYFQTQFEKQRMENNFD